MTSKGRYPIRLLVLLFLPAIAMAAEEDAFRLNQEALKAVESGDFGRAIVLLGKAWRLEPDNDTLRINLARVHSRHGINLYREKKYSEARDQLRLAVGLQPEVGEHHLQLGTTYYALRDCAAAGRSLREAIRLEPENGAAHENLGHVHYRQGESDAALREWGTALKIEPDNQDLRKLFERVTREIEVEREFLSASGSRFEIRYDAEISSATVDRLRSHLEKAHSRVGGVFSYYPTAPVLVVLYTWSDFARVTQGHRWVGGVYDGKIRMPLDPRKNRDLEATLLHEYTHVVIQALAPDCPAWLHEGIAQWQEGRRSRDVEAVLVRAKSLDKLTPVFELTESFARNEDPAVAKIQYAQALSFVEFLAGRFGAPGIPGLLRSLARKGSMEAAIEEVFRTKPDWLESTWLETLK